LIIYLLMIINAAKVLRVMRLPRRIEKTRPTLCADECNRRRVQPSLKEVILNSETETQRRHISPRPRRCHRCRLRTFSEKIHFL